MYSLLVVDDEEYAVEGIADGIDWTNLDISKIYKAYNAREAMDIFKEVQVDILISDIEMPSDSGIDLLRWVREHYVFTEAIFLTGHARFSYAQQALQLGCLDYVLKPADHAQLKDIVRRAIERINQMKEWSRARESGRMYRDRWVVQLPLLVEKFWLDILRRRATLHSPNLQMAMRQYQIPLQKNSRVLPVLVSVEKWHKRLSECDEERLGYAVSKAAEEMILQRFSGAVVREGSGRCVVIVYLDRETDRDPSDWAAHREKHRDTLDRDVHRETDRDISARDAHRNTKRDTEEAIAEIGRICHPLIEACRTHFSCNVSCYIGNPATCFELADRYGELLELERICVNHTNAVIYQGGPAAHWKTSSFFMPTEEWSALLEQGGKELLLHRMAETFRHMEEHDLVTAENLAALYYGQLQIIFHALHKLGRSVYQVYPYREISDPGVALKSWDSFREWSFRTMEAALDEVARHNHNGSEIIRKVKTYIGDHIETDISREKIAAHVYLNPGYLSRLFKKETGCSITDYILREKMERAKKKLAESNLKISQVASSVGYNHFSHFAKMFKKVTGLSPQRYRKMFRA